MATSIPGLAKEGRDNGDDSIATLWCGGWRDGSACLLQERAEMEVDRFVGRRRRFPPDEMWVTLVCVVVREAVK